MSDRRYAIMFLRLGFLASVLFAVFWGVWHISGHQVPAYTSLKLTENVSWNISFSRWWDILFAFFLVNIYAWILRVYYKFSLTFAEKYDIIVGLIAGLIAGLGAIFVTSFGLGLIAGLGLVASLVVGLVASLGVGLGVGLGFCINFLINVLFSFNFWKSIYNWFAAKNTA